MKTLLASTILIPAWNYPTYFLIISICLVFLIDTYNQYKKSKQIICVAIDWNAYSYSDIQAYAKLHGIKANQNKQTLINSLQTI